MPKPIQTDYFALEGGLNLVSPPITIPPGMVIDSMNFEPSIYGGYTRMKGIERYDGRTSPSAGVYYIMTAILTGAVVAGDTVTGVTSGATAVVLQVNGINELVVTRITGTFVVESITVLGVAKGSISSTSIEAATTALLHATYKNLAATSYRSLIQKVPGSGAVRGVKYYNGSLYAMRDNAGGTACIMHKATAAGWSAIAFGSELQFTAAVGQIIDGNTVTGLTSGATGVVRRALLRSGTWLAAGVGTLMFDTITGTFQNGEAIQVGGVTKVTASGANTLISWLPGGRFQIENYNFSGTLSTLRMYGCDGVNLMWEFDGTRIVPIRTGNTVDTPKYITFWQKMLVFGLSSSVQFSGIGQPYSYTALSGALEIALGDTVTGLLVQQGDATTGALAVFTANRTYMVYGTSTADLKLVTQAPEAGAQPYTPQNVGFAYYLDTKGVVQINSTQAFGNFEMSTITRLVQPLIDSKRGLATASCIVRSKNQYRLFFSDGTGLIIYVTQTTNETGVATGSAAAILTFEHGSSLYMNGVDSVVDTTGIERLFGAGSDGYVYELDSGTSIDGANITAYMFLAFNNNKTPRSRKHYKRVILQASCTGLAQVNVGYDLSYAGSESPSGVRALQTLIGGSNGYWEALTWDRFVWDTSVLQEYKIDTPGNGLNIGLLVYSDNAIDSPYTVSGAIINYYINRLER